MTLFKSIKPLIQICQLGGLVPLSFSTITLKWESNRLLVNLMKIHFILNISILTICTIFDDYLNEFNDTKLRVILYHVFNFLCYSHVFAILLETFFKRDDQKRLLNMLQTMEMAYQKHLNVQLNYERIKRSTNRFVFYCSFQFIIFTGFTITTFVIGKQFTTLYGILFYLPGYVFCKMNYIYMMSMIRLIGENMEVLNNYLKSMTKGNGYYLRDTYSNGGWINPMTNTNKLNGATLIFISRMYNMIWESTNLVNRLNHWSMPIGIFNEFYVLLYFAYYFLVYTLVLGESRMSPYIRLIFWLLNVIGTFSFISSTCCRTTEIVSFEN